MQRIRHGAHPVGKLVAVGHELAVVISAGGPAVVQHDVFVAQVLQAVFREQLGGVEEEGGGDGAGKGVPVVLLMEYSVSFVVP